MRCSATLWRCLTLLLVTLFLLTGAMLPAAGCGKTAKLSPETYAKIQKGMTLDEVESIAGQPERSHKLGSASSKLQTIYWYYAKTEGEGLVRVAFENGKVTNISPYNANVNPEE